MVSASLSRRVQRLQLAAHGGDLLVQQLDLGQRLRRDLLLLVERGLQPADGDAGAVALRARAFEQGGEIGILVLLGGEIILQRHEARFDVLLRRLLEREELRQFRDLGAQLAQGRILAGDFPRQQELRHHEHRQQEGDDQQQLRHRVHEAWPVGLLGSRARAAWKALPFTDAHPRRAPAPRRGPSGPVARISRRWISFCCVCWPCAHWRTSFCSSRICATRLATASASCSIESAPPSIVVADAAARRGLRVLQREGEPLHRALQRLQFGAQQLRRDAGDRRRGDGLAFARGDVGDGGQPVLEIDVEAVLRLRRLEIEEAEDQRSGEAEQRGREGQAHALERRLQALLQLVEQCGGLGRRHVQPLDGAADRLHGFEQAPEGAEQAEEDQEAHQIARHVARFVEAGGQRIEQRAHGDGREHRVLAVLEQHRHGGEQLRRLGRVFPAALAEAVDPVHFAEQAHHHAEGMEHAEQQRDDDHAVQHRVRHEGVVEPRKDDGDEHADEHGEHHHVHEIDPWRFERL